MEPNQAADGRMMGDAAPRVLVTGATGFVGRPLLRRLAAEGVRVRAALRGPPPAGLEAEPARVGPLGPETAWEAALAGIETVYHLAARVHVMDETAADPEAEFRRVNVEGTERLARACTAAGVRRLVFVSSVKAGGERSSGRPLDEADPPRPEDAYGRSKAEAERVLSAVAARSGLQVAVLRPPLVYGPEVKGNFLRLLHAVRRGVPLPLGAVRNARSLVYVENLVDALVTCARHPAAAGETFYVSDGRALSTPELIREIGAALGRRPRLLPVPERLLRAGAAVLGKGAAAERLLGSLEVSHERLSTRTGWTPPFTPAEGLRETAAWFRAGLA
jgi:nucleoside-diphosphate-sugar epimerase